jgi:hypothetical protein
MKESYYLLEGRAEVEDIEDALEETCRETAQEIEIYGNLLHYDGNSVEAVFSEERAYLRRENGASCLADMAVLTFIQYESEHEPGSEYMEVTGTEFQNHR